MLNPEEIIVAEIVPHITNCVVSGFLVLYWNTCSLLYLTPPFFSKIKKKEALFLDFSVQNLVQIPIHHHRKPCRRRRLTAEPGCAVLPIRNFLFQISNLIPIDAYRYALLLLRGFLSRFWHLRVRSVVVLPCLVFLSSITTALPDIVLDFLRDERRVVSYPLLVREDLKQRSSA